MVGIAYQPFLGKGDKMMFDGLNVGMGNLYRMSNAKTRSICAENFTGEKGKGGMCKLEDGIAGDAARDLL